jgi:hypothetical protein
LQQKKNNNEKPCNEKRLFHKQVQSGLNELKLITKKEKAKEGRLQSAFNPIIVQAAITLIDDRLSHPLKLLP